jgi:hypothetical protein
MAGAGSRQLLYPEADLVTGAAGTSGPANPNGTQAEHAGPGINRGSHLKKCHAWAAVIRDGRVDRVIVALGNGRFSPREVKLGREHEDRIEVLQGLSATDRVVTAGLFLIDAESNIRSSLARMTDRPGVQPTHEAAASSSDRQ